MSKEICFTLPEINQNTNYKIEYNIVDERVENLEEVLNDLGIDGWRFAGHSDYNREFLFWRYLENNEENNI